MSVPHIINLGLPKTGTTTLARALRRSGLKVADWRVRASQTKDTELHERLVGELIYEAYFETGDPLAKLVGFGAVSEMSAVAPGQNYWPQTDWALLHAILQHHPDTLFLLSRRDPQQTAESMMRWNTLGKRRLPRQYVPGLPKGFGTTLDQLARWIDGHYAFCRHVFAGNPQFLEYDIEDPYAPDIIAGFLGRDIPWWGRSNQNSTAQPVDEGA
ncbi:MAG: sulfotransferase [Paracoccaceae bacterium]